MRISLNWDHPAIADARPGGVEPKSIRAFNALILGRLSDLDRKRKRRGKGWFQSQFDDWLKLLDDVELDVLKDALPHLITRMHTDLKETVCCVREDDYYIERLPEPERTEALEDAERERKKIRKGQVRMR